MNNDDTVHSIGHIEQTVSVMMQLLLMIEVMVTLLVKVMVLAASSGDMMVSWDYRRKMVLMVTTHLIRVKMVMMTGDMKVMMVATRRLVREKMLVSDVFGRMMVT